MKTYVLEYVCGTPDGCEARRILYAGPDLRECTRVCGMIEDRILVARASGIPEEKSRGLRSWSIMREWREEDTKSELEYFDQEWSRV